MQRLRAVWQRCAARLLCCTALLACAPSHAGFTDDPWAARADVAFQQVLAANASLTAFAQTPDGFLWIGTQDGVLRWDGYRPRAYASDSMKEGALPTGLIRTMKVDSRGTLWVALHSGGLARYDPTTDRFERPFSGDRALSHRSALAIAERPDGQLWIGTGMGLDLVDPVHSTVALHADHAHRLGLPDVAVWSVLVDRSGAVWAGTVRGLYRQSGEGRFEPVALPVPAQETVAVTQLLQDADGRVWIGTHGMGAFVSERGDGTGIVSLRQFARQAQDGADRVLCMAEAAPGEVWIGTDGNGIVRIDARARTMRAVRHVERAPRSLAGDSVFALFRDRSGLLWVGSDTFVSYSVPAQHAFVTWWGAAGRADGPGNHDIDTLLAKRNGDLWLARGDGAVDIVRADGIVRLTPDASSPERALAPGRVSALVEMPAGDVYIGTQRGLFHVQADGSRLQRIEVPGRPPSGDVHLLCRQGDRLWLGGRDGLWALLPAEGARMQVQAHMPREQLNGVGQYSWLVDGDILWIGMETGISRVDTRTLEVSTLPAETPQRIAVPSGMATSLLKDPRGRLWAAMYGAGLRVIELDAQQRFRSARRVTTAEGLPHNGANTLALDGAGRMWISTNEGLATVDGDTLHATAYGVADGIGITGYWSNSGGTLPDGRVVFGGQGGLTIVNGKQLQRWDYAAPVVATDIHVGNEKSAAAWPSPQGPAHLLLVPPERRSLLVEFASLDLSASERNRYEYRLQGLHSDWIATSTSRRLATYTNLPPGDYVLQLRGSNRTGAWSPALDIPVRVSAAWYETAWFRFAAALLGVTAAIGVLQGRTLYLKRRQRELEMLVHERSAELEERTLQLEEIRRQLEQLTCFDPLTGLANRRLFNDELRRLLALQQRRGGSFTLMLVTLHRFKSAGESLGQEAGRALLSAASARLKQAMRETDVVAHLDSDEFALLLPDTHDPVDLEEVCRRIDEAMAPPVLHEGRAIVVHARIGVACFPRDGRDAEALYRAADQAMHAARGKVGAIAE
jgi:diguanylate cyclase (GGDEF)-like protein